MSLLQHRSLDGAPLAAWEASSQDMGRILNDGASSAPIAAWGCRFGQAAEAWVHSMAVGWRASTRQTVQSILTSCILPTFGHRLVTSITRAELLSFRARLIQEHRGYQGAQQLSAARANRVMTVLRQILSEVHLQEGTGNAGAAVRPLKERRQEIRPFAWAEVERLVAAAPVHLAGYLRVRCLSGLRSGEINGLRWDQVDFAGGWLRICRARVRGRETLPKNEYSERDLPLTRPLRQALELQWEKTGSPDGFVFQTTRGRPIETSNFSNRDWPAILARAGVAPRRPYQTRHTFASLMLGAGENPQWIAQMLGHADCQMLWRVYSRYVPNLTRCDGSAFEATVERLAA